MSVTSYHDATEAPPPPPQSLIPQGLPPLNLDRSIFSSAAFSAPVLVNAISQRVLLNVFTDGQPSSAGGQGSDSAAAVAASAFQFSTLSKGGLDKDLPQEQYSALASFLVTTFERAQSDVAMLLEDEQQRVGRAEAHCRHIESREKSTLNRVRASLEGTTQRIRHFEDAVANALTSTVGIEQHLTQSNLRVTRGKAVSTLLRYFQMFTNIQTKDLRAILKGLTKARSEQREKITSLWESGSVSHVDPRYFTTVIKAGDDATPSKGRKRAMQDEEDSDGSSDETNSSDDGDDDDEKRKNSSKGPLHRAELAAVAQGLDRFFASRCNTESQVEWIMKLSVLSKELDDIVGSAANVDVYLLWLRDELEEDCLHLVECFREFFELNPDTAAHQTYGKAILKTIELVGKLYGALCAGGKKDDPSGLLDVFLKQSVDTTAEDIATTHAVKQLPPQPPLPEITMSSVMSFFQSSIRRDINGVKEFLSFRIRREVIIVETMVAGGIGGSLEDPTVARSAGGDSTRDGATRGDGSANDAEHSGRATQARQQLFAKILDNVVKPYVEQSVAVAESHMKEMLRQDGQLTPRSKRKCTGRVADSIALAHSVTAELFSFAHGILQLLENEFGAAEVAFLYDFIPIIFPSRERYVTQRLEVELLKRYIAQAEEAYMRSLLPPADKPFDCVPEHMKKLKELTQRMEELTERVVMLAAPNHIPRYVSDIVQTGLDHISKYLIAEADKSLKVIKADTPNWTKRPKNGEDAWINPTPDEAHLCSVRILLFVQDGIKAIFESLRTIEKIVADSAAGESGASLLTLDSAADPVVASPVVSKVNEIPPGGTSRLRNSAPFTTFPSLADFIKLDDICEDILNLVSAAVVTKSLSILLFTQEKKDFLPAVEREKGAAVIVVRPASRTCGMFCQYLSFQLQQLQQLLAISCGQLWKSSAATNLQTAGAASPTTTDRDRSLTSLKSREDAIAKVKSFTLQQLLFGDGGPSSLVRSIGVSLYRGISAHLKSFRVNEGGALIFKQDVNEYKSVIKPLTSTNGLDSLIVDRLFSLLREASGLLLAAIENIRQVKISGLLGELMSNEEKVKFLEMREDLKEGFRSSR